MKNGVKTLNKRNISKILDKNPTINSFTELCAFWGVEEEDIDEESKKLAEKVISNNITRLRVQIKNELLKGENRASFKEHEMLYKLICTEDEIKRLKAGDRSTNINNSNTTVKPTIQIQSSDNDIMNKLLDL